MKQKTGITSFQPYYDFLDKIYKKPKKTLIAISGGPDSIYVTHIMQQYWKYKKRDDKYLYYIYCDHSIRKNNNDKQAIQKIVDNNKLHISKRENNKKADEESLRTRRYQQINMYSAKHRINMLITGHNLSDRIESTFLHLLRGAQIDGFLSMKKEEKQSHIFAGTILRPLLEANKESIQQQCTNLGLHYVQDHTNDDINFSKRNYIRKNILQPLKELSHKHNQNSNSFEESMLAIYNRCQKKHKTSKNKLVPIPRYKIRKSEWAYRWDIKQKNISTDRIKNILDTLQISNNIGKKNMEEIAHFLKNKEKGHKYINKHYRFIAHKKIYIIKAKKDFWKEIINAKPKSIQGLFIDPLYTEGTPTNRRFAKQTDKIKGKSIKKRCINQKIPLFWRTNIIVSEDGEGKIHPYIPVEMRV